MEHWFGLPLPDGVTPLRSWSARAILRLDRHNKPVRRRGRVVGYDYVVKPVIEMVPDRSQYRGPDLESSATRSFFRWLDKDGLPRLRKEADRMALAPDDDHEIAIDNGRSTSAPTPGSPTATSTSSPGRTDMGRRRKPEPGERISADWRSYQPTEALYWALGGPFIPVENIPPQKLTPEYMGGGMKGQARRNYVLRLMADSERDLAKAVTRYREVKEKGMEALHAWVREAWQQTVHGCGALSQSRDGTSQGKPDPVSEAMGLAYREIGYYRGRILACNAALDELDRTNQPLFRRRNP